MTAAKVVDASAIAAILFEEPEQDTLLAELSDSALNAPFLLPHEIASVCVKKIRRDSPNSNRFLEAVHLLPQFGIQYHPIEVRAVAELAIRHALTAYDASYLWLARELDAELVTLDKELIAAAKFT